MKILAVDDDALILELLVETLKSSGYPSITTASCAQEAATIIADADEPFDCLLFDVMMPGVTGIELAAWVRRQPLYQTAPILMITSMSEKTFIDNAFRAGATDYITKPFDVVEVVTRVRLAERQLQSSRQMRRNDVQIQALTAQLDDRNRVALSEPITLDDVDGLIDFHALQNYLLQMGRGSFFATSVLSMRIIDVGNIYARCTATQFRDILADVAESALGALAGNEFIMSYAGNGTFSGVIASAENIDFEEIADIINLSVEQLQLTDAQHNPISVRIAIGEPRPIGIMKSGRVAVSEMLRTIEDLSWNMPNPAKPSPRSKRGGGSLFMRAVSQAF